MPSKPKILLIADVRGWIFERHCHYISKILEKDFLFNTSFHRDNYGYYFDEDAYDLIYPLEFDLLHPHKDINPQKYITGIRSHSSWGDFDYKDLGDYLSSKFNFIHVVSEELGAVFKGILPSGKYYGVVHHGVDTKLFSPNKQENNTKEIVLGWAGNRNANACKGFEFIEKLEEVDGVSLKYCGYADKNLNAEQMVDFHNSLDTYVCASETEGHNNSLIESACVGNSLITTINGTVPEYLVDEENALIVNRDDDSFRAAIEKLRDNPSLRESLGQKARETVLEKFCWEKKALDFKAMFEKALNDA